MMFLRGVGILMGKGDIQGFGESFLPVGAWQIGFLHLPKIQVYGFTMKNNDLNVYAQGNNG
jgi:hypothetical protein